MNEVKHESKKMCGYFGCHVGNAGDCECTQCSAYQTRCSDCEKFPNRARRDASLAIAMQKKCDLCRKAGK